MVYLTHPNHGTHIAYTNLEVEECIKAGWTIKEEPLNDTSKKEPVKPQRGRPKAK